MSDHVVAAERRELPNRRIVISTVMVWGGIRWLHGSGFDFDGSVREIFAEPIEAVHPNIAPRFPLGEDLAILAHEICISVSHVLQRGVTAAAHAARLAPAPSKQARPSLPYALIAQAVDSERVSRDQVMEIYAAQGLAR